ncbi:MAG: CRISPR-associated helicase Cas3' [Mycobacteriaceae bacterium]
MKLTAATQSAWAKYNRNTGESLSLVRHCQDAAAVALLLWDRWLPDSTKTLLSNGRTGDEVRALASWLAGTHDVGKLSPAFAVQVEELTAPMRDAGLQFDPRMTRRSETPHSLVSNKAIIEFLVAKGWNKRVANTFAVIGGGHHGAPPTHEQLGKDSLTEHVGGKIWAECRSELLEYISQATGAEKYLPQWQTRALTSQEQALWTAFVIMADWISSDDRFFPLGENRDSSCTAEQMWEDLAFFPPWQAKAAATLKELLHNRFHFPEDAKPRPIQSEAFASAQAMKEPGLIIIEAEMGVGKTEAALAVAEILAEKFGQGGLFVALPTMATSNAMFSRVLSWIEAQEGMAAASAVLAHSKAGLNEDYQSLDSEKMLGSVGDDVCAHGATVIAHSWMSGRKRKLLAEFVVGTIDQLLFMALKAKHVALRHLAFTNKVVIVDEVHATDVYMSVYLHRALEWLGAYNVPVILLSATLPSDQRIQLVQAYETGQKCKREHPDLVGDIGYPLITVCTRENIIAKPVSSSGQSKKVVIRRLNDENAELITLLTEQLAEGGCVGIIRNTVGRAQELARVLEQHFPGEVVLLHSRFIAKHRSDLEAQLVKELGPNGSRPFRHIVVGTQVIEQSLDIDFDVMISDLAPIDLLFQRMGRLHRHVRDSRPEWLQAPQFFITGVQDWSSEPPKPIAVSESIYSSVLLLRCLAVLENCDQVELPLDIAKLVQAAYSENLSFPDSWAEAFHKAVEKDLIKRNKSEDKASTFLLSRPHSSSTLVGWLMQNVGEANDARGQAQVRDTDEGIEVIVTQKIDGQVRLPVQCGGEVIDTDFAPHSKLARQALTATVRLPMSLTLPGIIDRTISELEKRSYPGWQDSKWLAGELILELDAECKAKLNGYWIHYDHIEGLLVEKEE